MEIYNEYNPHIDFKKKLIKGESLCFCFDKESLLLDSNGELCEVDEDVVDKSVCFGYYKGKPVFAIMLLDDRHKECNRYGIRDLFSILSKDLMFLARKAKMVLHFFFSNSYCGVCGSDTIPLDNELAVKCTNCNKMIFPKISPAIIVSVRKGDKLLLAHAKRFENNLYSNIAGFVEVGETLEDCVRREVMEEVGIKVKDIKYQSSQSWPFPDSLMIGFTAVYSSGEIKVDGDEIEKADWFDIDKLPLIPGDYTIARQLIDNHIIKIRNKL